MKRKAALILVLLLLLVIPVDIIQAETDIQYGTIKTRITGFESNNNEYYDMVVMIYKNCVMVNTEALSEKLDLDFKHNKENNSFSVEKNKNIVIFTDNSDKALYVLGMHIFNYELPCNAIINEYGFWAPLDMFLSFVDSEKLIVEDGCLEITKPKDTIMDIYGSGLGLGNEFFDIVNVMGQDTFNIMNAATKTVNIYSGIISGDIWTYAQLITSLWGSTSAYDAKYSYKLASLMVGNSENEAHEMSDNVGFFADLLSEHGPLGICDKEMDNLVGKWDKICTELEKTFTTNNPKVQEYNYSYQQLEKALKSKNTPMVIRDLGDELDKLNDILTYISWYQDFSARDESIIDSLDSFLEYANNNKTYSNNASITALKAGVEQYKSIVKFGFINISTKLIQDKLTDAIKDGLHPIANCAIWAWDIIKEVVPFFSEGLDNTEKFELSIYSMIFSVDAQNHVLTKRQACGELGTDNLIEENLEEYRKAALAYLKFCYVSRNSGIATIPSTDGQVPTIITEHNDINKEIAKKIDILKCTNYGFLPSLAKKMLADSKEINDNLRKHILITGDYRVEGNLNTPSVAPTNLPNSYMISTISAAGGYNVVLKRDGTVIANGYNKNGECNVSEWTDIIAISARGHHTVGLKRDGTVVAVGDNEYGQCNVSEWTDIVAVSASGASHTVGLKRDGTVVAVGDNEYGQCNVSEWTDIIAISAGGWHTMGLKRDGTVVAVGDNEYSQCNVSNWTDIIAISAGGKHTVGLKKDGTVIVIDCFVAGSNNEGRIITDDSNNIITDIVAISTGYGYTLLLREDGTVGMFGIGYSNNSSIDFSFFTDIVSVHVGADHIIGIKKDGTVVATGGNDYGQCDVDNWNLFQ